jgi:predicted acetyltransferase
LFLSFQYWLVNGNKFIGRIKYRPILNEALKSHGGNIGYKVRPSERGKGYASQMLNEVIKKAKSDGLNEVFMTCDSDNIASIKIIEKSGGVLQSS